MLENRDNWERFYTDANGYAEEDMMVDQVEIDVKNNRFILIENADIMITDGEDDDGYIMYSNYISREMFDLLVDALRVKGLQQTTWKEICPEDFEDDDI